VRGGGKTLPKAVLMGVGAVVLLGMAATMWLVMNREKAEARKRLPGVSPAEKAELSAERRWKTAVARLDKPRLSTEEAMDLDGALKEFKSAFGKTEFAASKAADIARLEKLAASFLGRGGGEVRKMYDYATKYWKEHPGEYDVAIAKFETVIKQAEGTQWLGMSQRAVEGIKAARGQAIAAAVAERVKGAREFVDKGDVDGGLAELGRRSSKFGDLMVPGLEAEAGKLREETEARFKALTEAADKMGKDGEPAAGLKKLAELDSLKYAAWAERIAALKTRLEKQRGEERANKLKQAKARARGQLTGILDQVDALVLEGKYVEAVQALASKKQGMDEDERAVIRAELDSAAKIAESLKWRDSARQRALAKLAGKSLQITDKSGRVHDVTLVGAAREGLSVRGGSKTYLIPFAEMADGQLERLVNLGKPGIPEDHLAAMLLAMRGKNYAAARKSLAAAGDHLLKPHYQAKLEKAAAAAAEAGAESAWKKDVQPLAGDAATKDGAKDLLEALKAYLGAHGTTTFAKGKSDEIAKLRAKATKVATTPVTVFPETLAEKVKLLFAGKVEVFKEATLDIVLRYDFEDPKQAGDWLGALPGTRGGRKTMLATGVPGVGCRFFAPFDARRLQFTAECEPTKDPHIVWFMQADQCRKLGRNSGHMRSGRHATVLSGAWSQKKDRQLAPGLRYRMTVTADPNHEKLYWGTGRDSSLMVKYKWLGPVLALGTKGAGSRCHFDDVCLVGRLDRNWLKMMTEALPARGRLLIYPEADAHVRGGKYSGQNKGSASTLGVCTRPYGAYTREAYLRFDLSALRAPPKKAVLRLFTAYATYDPKGHGVYAVADDSWSETKITWKNKPDVGSRLGTGTPACGRVLRFNVTKAVQTEFAGDKKLSLRVRALELVKDSLVYYGSRESSCVWQRPVLVITE
jgi:hypothetical protein